MANISRTGKLTFLVSEEWGHNKISLDVDLKIVTQQTSCRSSGHCCTSVCCFERFAGRNVSRGLPT
jgi:hypothetical protein